LQSTFELLLLVAGGVGHALWGLMLPSAAKQATQVHLHHTHTGGIMTFITAADCCFICC
jgi:hypothetical protein